MTLNTILLYIKELVTHTPADLKLYLSPEISVTSALTVREYTAPTWQLQHLHMVQLARRGEGSREILLQPFSTERELTRKMGTVFSRDSNNGTEGIDFKLKEGRF